VIVATISQPEKEVLGARYEDKVFRPFKFGLVAAELPSKKVLITSDKVGLLE